MTYGGQYGMLLLVEPVLYQVINGNSIEKYYFRTFVTDVLLGLCTLANPSTTPPKHFH